MAVPDLLDELLDRWEENHRRGDALSPEELCRKCPDLLEAFRERIQALRAMDRVLDESDGVPRSEERRVGKECRYWRDWSSDVCSSDLRALVEPILWPSRTFSMNCWTGGRRTTAGGTRCLRRNFAANAQISWKPSAREFRRFGRWTGSSMSLTVCLDRKSVV